MILTLEWNLTEGYDREPTILYVSFLHVDLMPHLVFASRLRAGKTTMGEPRARCEVFSFKAERAPNSAPRWWDGL